MYLLNISAKYDKFSYYFCTEIPCMQLERPSSVQRHSKVGECSMKLHYSSSNWLVRYSTVNVKYKRCQRKTVVICTVYMYAPNRIPSNCYMTLPKSECYRIWACYVTVLQRYRWIPCQKLVSPLSWHLTVKRSFLTGNWLIPCLFLLNINLVTLLYISHQIL